MIWVPILTTKAGSCLTVANWQEQGVHVAMFRLADLLIKPGWDVLRHYDSLASFWGWPGEVLLDDTMEKQNSAGDYVLVSPFDGAKSTYSPHFIQQCIIHLKPQDARLYVASDAPAQDGYDGRVYFGRQNEW